MVEFLVQFLPLIFLCSAIGVILLNFDAIGIYIVYVLSMLTQPKEIIQASSSMMSPLPDRPTLKHKSANIFVRTWTLFKVLFLPELDFDSLLNRNKNSIDATLDVFSEKTREEVSKFKIKTYSVSPEDVKKTQFKYSYEPATAPSNNPLDHTKSLLFTDLSSFGRTSKEQEREKAVQREEQDIELGITHYTSTDKIQNKAPVNDRYAATGVLPTIKSQPNTAYVEETFDVKEEKVHLSNSPALKKVDFGQITSESSRVNELTSTNFSVTEQQQTQKKNTSVEEVVAGQPMQVFQNTTRPGFSLGDLFTVLWKLLYYAVVSIPILVVVGSITLFLAQHNWNLSKIGEYPQWISLAIENFVKQDVVTRIK